MANISQRIARLEEKFGEAGCVCSERSHDVVCIVLNEQIEAAEAAAQFYCPTHGLRTPILARLSPTDANL